MIFRDAIRSLKHDRTRSFFYWLTFVITSMFMFLFFAISMSDVLQVTFVNARNDISTNITLFVIILSSVDLFFANDFFVRNKAKSLAVQLVCGARYSQLAAFLLIQTAILLVLAIPFGIMLGSAALPLVNLILATVLESKTVVTVSLEAMAYMTFVMAYIIFWTTLLNLSFAYRNSAAMLMNGNGLDISAGGFFVQLPLSAKKRKLLCVLLYLLPMAGFFYSSEGALMFSIISLAGLMMTIRSVILPWLDKKTEEYTGNPVKVITCGFLRTDFRKMNKNIILHLIASIILLSTAAICGSAADTVLVLVSFCIMNCIQALSIMFTFFTVISLRKKNFMTLWQLGCILEDFQAVIRRETWGFYGFLLGAGLAYLAGIVIPALARQIMNPALGMILTAGYVLPLLAAGTASQLCYGRMVAGILEHTEK